MAGRLKKINWKRGSGELIGFAISLPLLMIVFCGIIMATQLGLAKQTLEYATYSATRLAVVQNDMAAAQNAGDLLADATLRTGTFGVTGYDLEYEVVAGTSDPSRPGMIKWEKGALLKTVLSVDIDTIAPFGDSILQSEMIMMIERPVFNPTVRP